MRLGHNGGFRTCIAALVVVAGCAACKDEPAAGAAGGKGPKGPMVVRVLAVHPEKVARTIELTGTLGGDEEVTVSAEVEGKVERIDADLGDPVKQGGVIVRLADLALRLRAEAAEADFLTSLAKLGIGPEGLDGYDRNTAPAVRKATADLEDARRQFERVEQLHQKNLAADTERDVAKTRVTIAEAQLDTAREEIAGSFAAAKSKRAASGLARKALRDASITSPLNGVLAKRLVSLGELVKAGQPVALVVVQNPLKLRGEVPERYAGLVLPGMPVSVRIDSTGALAEGKVSRVGPAVQASSRTFSVEAQIDNSSGALRPGVFAVANVVVGSDEEVIAVPDTAVSAVAGVTKVFVEDGGKAVEKRVQVLKKRGDQALVIGDVKDGDRVILTAVARLFAGAEVKVDAATEAPAPARPALPAGG